MQQSNSLDFKLVQRVCLLQQALDQALETLDELTAQVQDKYLVETQLASTEKYANVQQQAIKHLKQQLTQFTEIQDHLLGAMGFQLHEVIDQQQQVLDQLNIQFQQGHTELQTYLRYLTQQQQTKPSPQRGSEEHYLALEAEVMVARSMAVHLSQYLAAAKQHLEHLNTDLSNHQINFEYIIKTIRAMIADLSSFDQKPAKLRPQLSEAAQLKAEVMQERSHTELEVTVAAAASDVDALQTNVRRQQLRIEELQTALTKQMQHETHLRQRYQAVAAERDYYRHELQKLQQTKAPQVIRQPSVKEMIMQPDSQLAETDSPLPAPRLSQRSQPSQPIQPLRLPQE
ncbi:MAG: hypothetical protein AAGD09_13610 [Cyanobacteria bacterium P01_F01_bin.56]